MKKYFNVTLALEVETDSDIQQFDILDINFNDLDIKCKNAVVKVVDIPECYEVFN